VLQGVESHFFGTQTKPKKPLFRRILDHLIATNKIKKPIRKPPQPAKIKMITGIVYQLAKLPRKGFQPTYYLPKPAHKTDARQGDDRLEIGPTDIPTTYSSPGIQPHRKTHYLL